MNATVVIPTYWAGDDACANAPGTYDHSTKLNAANPELDRNDLDLNRISQVTRCAVWFPALLERLIAAILERHERAEVVFVHGWNVAQAKCDIGVGHPLDDEASAGVGYLLKERVSRVADFLAALDVVRAGGTVVDPAVVTAMMRTRRGLGSLGRLTPREAEVLELMAQGASNSQIADRLVLSMAAVTKHVANIFVKLDLPPGEDNRRVRAVLAWLDAGAS